LAKTQWRTTPKLCNTLQSKPSLLPPQVEKQTASSFSSPFPHFLLSCKTKCQFVFDLLTLPFPGSADFWPDARGLVLSLASPFDAKLPTWSAAPQHQEQGSTWEAAST